MSTYLSRCQGPQDVGLISGPGEVVYSSNAQNLGVQSPEDFSKYKDVDLDPFPIGQHPGPMSLSHNHC